MLPILNRFARLAKLPRSVYQQTARSWFFGRRDKKPAKAKEEKQTLYNNEALNDMVRKKKVVIFMKGRPNVPLCGYSNTVCQIMQMHGVEFAAYDVLNNDRLKASIKDFTQWPTIPQVFIDGEFIGGCDILIHMHKNGDLVRELQKVGIESKFKESEVVQMKKSMKDGKK